jgi:hypothetical protein
MRRPGGSTSEPQLGRSKLLHPQFRICSFNAPSFCPWHSRLGITMREPIASQFISRRRLLWLAAMAAAVAAPASTLPMSDARAQSDQAPAAEPATPKKKAKSKTKTKKTAPGHTIAPPANPPATPKQQ